MTDDEIRENVRPRGNVTPLPRMQESADDELARDAALYGVSIEERRIENGEIVRRRVDPRDVSPEPSDDDRFAEARRLGAALGHFAAGGELPYPDGPLASRRAPGELMDDEQYAELTRSIRSHHDATGVRIWLVWHGEPEIAEQIASGLREVAETLGFTHLETTVGLMEEGPG